MTRQKWCIIQQKWRRERSIERTLAARPDLIENAVLSKKEKLFWDNLLAAQKNN